MLTSNDLDPWSDSIFDDFSLDKLLLIYNFKINPKKIYELSKNIKTLKNLKKYWFIYNTCNIGTKYLSTKSLIILGPGQNALKFIKKRTKF